MHQRRLGRSDLSVSALGLGCMGMSEFYGSSSESESIATLRRAVELGVSFWDTADMYGQGRNEQLLGKCFAQDKGLRERVILATKFGVLRDESGSFTGVCGRPDHVREACDRSLQRLGVETIDLYYQHRVDPAVPIEDTVGAMAGLVEAGKVRHLGLSEAGPQTLRRAAAIHPITALQTEYSLWSRDVEESILPTCRELGIGLVAYSPLGRGFLTGQIRSPEDLDEDDWRRSNPRFVGANFDKNLDLVREIEVMAQEMDATPAQLALAWLLSRGSDIVPIPGTRSTKRLEENVGATGLALSADDLDRIDRIFPVQAASGTRYPEAAMSTLSR